MRYKLIEANPFKVDIPDSFNEDLIYDTVYDEATQMHYTILHLPFDIPIKMGKKYQIITDMYSMPTFIACRWIGEGYLLVMMDFGNGYGIIDSGRYEGLRMSLDKYIRRFYTEI